MDRNKDQQDAAGRHEHPLPSEIGKEERQKTALAHDEAEKILKKTLSFLLQARMMTSTKERQPALAMMAQVLFDRYPAPAPLVNRTLIQ